MIFPRGVSITLDLPERGVALEGSLDSGRLELRVSPPAPRDGGISAKPTVGPGVA